MTFKIFLCSLFFFHSITTTPPQLTIILVIDQLSYHTLKSMRPFFTGAFKKFLDNGIVFTHARWPHSRPSTATGHTGLVTGCWPAMHGIIDNKWMNENNVIINADEDINAKKKSAKNVMVDTLTDQWALHHSPFNCWALSLKSRAALMMAGHVGNAVWFEEDSHSFVCNTVQPQWLISYNKTMQFDAYKWNTVFPITHHAYGNRDAHYYQFVDGVSPLQQYFSDKKSIMKTPQAHELLLACARTCVFENHQKNEPFFLLVSISATDHIGHSFGPESIEYKDMLYHLDQQLERFLQDIYTQYPPENVLIMLTADHASMPIIESVALKGFSQARRILTPELQRNINELITKKFNIESIITYINNPNIYLNKNALKTLSLESRKQIIGTIKKYIESIPGIYRVWEFHELANACIDANSYTFWYQQQLFKNRSGDLIITAFPYTYITDNTKGTGHESPYWYDTHVPLIFYQPTVLKKRTISRAVFVPQVAATLADILEIPRPSASVFEPLQGLIR